MKKIALFLAVVLLLGAFAACAPKEPTPTQAPDPTPVVTPTPTAKPSPTPVVTPKPQAPLVFQGGWERMDDATGKSYITVTSSQILSFDGETLLSTTTFTVKSAEYDANGNMVVTLEGNDNVYTIFKDKDGIDYGDYTYMEITMGSTVVKMIRMK